MLENDADLTKYLTENFMEITNLKVDDEHFNDYCPSPKCKREVGLQVIECSYAQRRTGYHSYLDDEWGLPYTMHLRCPRCGFYKLWILFKREFTKKKNDGQPDGYTTKLYRVASIPAEGIDIPELPDNPKSLRAAYNEAIRCMNASCSMAAAAMFRRALQIITRDILGAKPGRLADEIKSLIGIKNKLGIILTNDFSANGYIIKECGNQSAHPDKDPDLLSFESDDAQALYEIFLELVSELFVAPTVAKKAKEDLLKRRKITVKP